MLTQSGGTLDLGGDVYSLMTNPTLGGDVTWKNGTFYIDFWGEFRPAQGTTLTLKDGAGLRKNTYWRTFIDKGMTFTLDEDAGVTDVPGPFVVTCDSTTDNYLNVRGGALVVTNASEANYAGRYAITIASQRHGGRGFMNVSGGRVVTHRLRIAAGYDAESTAVTSTGTVSIVGGTVELLDKFALGTSSTTRSLATLNLNGGEAIVPNGFLMYNDDLDVVTFNGTAFKANADCAKYFDLRKNSGANVTIAAGGFPIEVASGKTVAFGWGLKGVGGIVKTGAGTLVLDKDATFGRRRAWHGHGEGSRRGDGGDRDRLSGDACGGLRGRDRRHRARGRQAARRRRRVRLRPRERHDEREGHPRQRRLQRDVHG